MLKFCFWGVRPSPPWSKKIFEGVRRLGLNKHFRVFDRSRVGKRLQDPQLLQGPSNHQTAWAATARGRAEVQTPRMGNMMMRAWVRKPGRQNQLPADTQWMMTEWSSTRLILFSQCSWTKTVNVLCIAPLSLLVQFWGHFAPADWCVKH